MMRVLIFLCAGFLLPVLSVAQQKKSDNSSLLWRISHPKMQRASFLYGTMHLQDKRLFHFTDSVYESIRSVEGFAGELDMNDMNELITSWIKNEETAIEEQVLLKDHISAAQKKRYKTALEKKFKKSFDLITLKELESASDDWSFVFRKEDDMPTFVDAYLFGIARNHGKWTGALETIKDQVDAPQPTDLEATIQGALLEDKIRKKMMENFISIYLSEDLSRMNELVVKASGEYDNRKMNDRNLNMVHRMDSLAAIRSCFYAVGAAHLPGDSGIIQLLRSRGYKVEPVHSEKRITPDQYLLHQPDIRWEEISLANDDFKIKMPGKANSIDGLGGFQHARIYFDPMSMSGFLTGFIPITNQTEAQIDSSCQKLPEMYASEGTLYRDSVWKINGRNGYEIEASTKEGFVNMMMNPVPGGIVMNMIISMSRAGLKMNHAITFFQSFIVNKIAIQPPASGWRRKLIALQQVSYESPIELELTATKNDSSWITHTYSAMDPATQAYYTLNVMETLPGLYSSLDSLYFDEIMSQYLDNKTYRLLSHSYFEQDGFPGIALKMGTKLENDSIHYLFNVINRGNRRYAYLAGYFPTENNRSDAERFIKGLRFLPYVSTTTVSGEVPFENYRIQSPVRFTPDRNPDIEEGLTRYLMYDSTSAVTIHVQKEPLNKYYRAAGDSIFVREQMNYFLSESDSIQRLEISTVDGNATAQGWIYLAGTHNLKRVKLMASGDTLYSVSGVISPEVNKTTAYNRMFESFRVQHFTPNTYTQSKARKVFQDLLLPDSIAFNEAKEAVKWVEISGDDLPYLHEALLNPLIDFSERSACTHDEVIQRVVELKDKSTIGFIQQAYQDLKERNAVLQYPLLSVLARFNTSESYRVIETLLESGLPTAGNPGILYASISDSIDLAEQLLPVVLKYKNDSLLRIIIPGMVLTLKEAGKLPASVLDELKPVLLRMADQYQQQLQQKDLALPVLFESFLEVMTLYPTIEFQQRLDSLAYHNHEDVQYSTAKILLKQQKPVAADVIQKIATDPFYRSSLYAIMENAGQLKKFPRAYSKQPLIAESQLYRDIWYGTADYKLSFLKQISLKQDGKKLYYYLYKVSFVTDEGEENYLGVAGPYTSKSRIDTTPREYTGVYYDELLDESRLMEQLEAFIQSQQ
ncbi:MAG: TraB/GumN family protein [Flavipsychrobacter sp.]|nr:TraB/GumN family protein [Flavipsychrobacter sp.]